MKPIPGFPGYTINEKGELFNPKGKLITRRDEWQGYPRARLKHESGKFVNRKIHTLVALAHLGEGKEVRHLDNNRANFHLHNLEWGDRFSNAKDRLERGSYHLKTQLANGKSLLVLGDDKYLDPEAKKVYHVTDHPIGEEGVIPITSLEKIAAWFKKPGLIDSVKNKYHVKPLINKAKIALEDEGFVDRGSLFPSQLIRAKYEKAFQNAGFAKISGSSKQQIRNMKAKRAYTEASKQAEWTSKKNADSHALKHADEMGLTKEQYIALAKAALKDKLSAIGVKKDILKSRDSKGNILVHKDGKVITYYSKLAYVRKLKKHAERAVSRIRDSEHHGDAYDLYQRRQEAKKNK